MPLQTIDDKESELRTFAAQIDLVTAELESADGVVRGLLDDLLTTIPLVDRLLRDTEPHLGAGARRHAHPRRTGGGPAARVSRTG